MESPGWNCLVIDAGARYGLHPSWRDARDLCEFHLFEPEPIEADRLKIRYKAFKNISVHPKALALQSGTETLILRAHLGLSTLISHELDTSLLLPKFRYLGSETRRIEVATVCIDDYFSNKRVDFMKLDTEGSDFEILQGATKALTNTVLGVRINVNFRRIHSNSPTFSEIDIWLSELGFYFRNLEMDVNSGNTKGLFPLSTSSGSLIAGDAIWTRDPKSVSESNNIETITYYALFLYLNGLEDVGLQFLVDSSKLASLQFESATDNKVVYLLETKILAHLASALTAGWWDSKEIYKTYTKLFNKEFPTKEDLYLRLNP